MTAPDNVIGATRLDEHPVRDDADDGEHHLDDEQCTALRLGTTDVPQGKDVRTEFISSSGVRTSVLGEQDRSPS